MSDEITFIVNTVLTSGVVAAVVVYLARAWISERLRQAIAHEYAQKLEAHRAALKSEYDVQMERLRAENTRQQAVEVAARASLADASRAVHERRLTAAGTAWTTILRVRDAASPAVIYLDILTDDELAALPNNQRARSQIEKSGGDMALNRIAKAAQGIDESRPFIGDQIYTLLYVYRAISLRVEFLLARCLERERFDPWWTDSGVRQHLGLVLDKQELQRIDDLPVGRFGQVRSLLELKILQEIQTLISGEQAARFTIERASAIAEVARRTSVQNLTDRRDR